MIVVADTGPIVSLAVIDNKRIETVICRNARQKKVLFCRVVK